MNREKIRLDVAQAVYAQFPNGAYVRPPSTGYDPILSPTASPSTNDLQFVPDAWKDAPDRHEQCLAIAAAALAVAEPVIRARALEDAAKVARNKLAYADTTSEADKEVVAAILALQLPGE